MSFLLGLPIFRGYVKFPGCTLRFVPLLWVDPRTWKQLWVNCNSSNGAWLQQSNGCKERYSGVPWRKPGTAWGALGGWGRVGGKMPAIFLVLCFFFAKKLFYKKQHNGFWYQRYYGCESSLSCFFLVEFFLVSFVHSDTQSIHENSNLRCGMLKKQGPFFWGQKC